MSEQNNDNNNQQQPIIKDNERDKEELMDNLDCCIYHSLAFQICIGDLSSFMLDAPLVTLCTKN